MSDALTPHAHVQILLVLAKRLARAKDREEEAKIVRDMARHSTRYDVIVSQGEHRT